MKLDIKNLQNQVDEWIKTHGVRYFDIHTNTIQLAEEVGEVGRIIARRYGEQSEKESDKKKDLGEELCDVLFVCFCISNQESIELVEIFQKELNKKEQSESILSLMINLIIQTGKIAELIIDKDEKNDKKLAGSISNVIIYLLKMASQTQIDLGNRFIERMEEKAIRDHNRNWTNEKLR